MEHRDSNMSSSQMVSSSKLTTQSSQSLAPKSNIGQEQQPKTTTSSNPEPAPEIDFNQFKKIMYSSGNRHAAGAKKVSNRKYLPENVLLNSLDQHKITVR